MRISDWSSDVCSSDLHRAVHILCLHPKILTLPSHREQHRADAIHLSSQRRSGDASMSSKVHQDSIRLKRLKVDRKSDVSGKSVSVRVDLGGRRIFNKNNKKRKKKNNNSRTHMR